MILGIRPTDFEHGATRRARISRACAVKPDVVEDLGSEHHVIFTLDAPRVTAEAVRAAADDEDDEGKLFADDRAIFTAVRRRAARGLRRRRRSSSRSTTSRLHFFDPATGAVLTGAAQPSPVA